MAKAKQHGQSRVTSLAFCGLSIALMAVSAWITIPLGPIPFTLQTLAVMFVVFTLRPSLACVSILGYLILGGLGVPVFSGFRGGLAALLGPTGGFIVGFLVAGALAAVVGALLKDKGPFSSQSKRTFFGRTVRVGNLARLIVMGVLFLVVLYLFGWAWLMYLGNLTPEAAFVAAVGPFIPVDALKMVAAVLLTQAVSQGLGKRL